MTSISLERISDSIRSRVGYLLHDFWDDVGDPRVAHMPLMSSGPLPILGCCLTYVLFVTVIGPALMKHRKAFDLRELMTLHNCFLIGINGCGFLVGLWITNGARSSWACKAVNGHQTPFQEEISLYLGYVLMMSKLVDFLDTVFFVLRKKWNQVTFLHVFHHALMPAVVWLGLKVHPAGMSSWLPLVNAFVHFVMYSYYSLSCAGFRDYLWWKKHITQLQLVQFVIVFAHGAYATLTPDCDFPKILSVLECFYSVLFFQMFYAFYRRAYGTAKKLQ